MATNLQKSARQEKLHAFRKQASNNELASYFIDKMFGEMSDSAQDVLAGIITTSIQRYANVPEIKAHVGGSDINLHLDAIINAFPTFIFLLSNQFGEQEEFYDHAKDLKIVGIASMMTKNPAHQSHVRLFLEHIDPNDDLKTLIDKVSDQNSDLSYFPRVLNKDFQMFRRTYKDMKPTQNIHELIDLLFSFQGLLQVFLRYYFNLLRHAQTDAIAVHIDRIFNGLFAAFRLQEIKYWNSYRDSSKIQNELIQTIRLDITRKRHPVLRRQIFETLKNYHPIIKDARTHYSDSNVRQFLASQVDDFVAFSTIKQAVFLDTIQKCKGRSNVVYLLTQILSRDGKKLVQLQNHLNKLGEKANQELLQLVNHLVGKMSSTMKRENVQSANKTNMGVVLQTAESLRRSQAQKRLKDREKARGMSVDQVSKVMDTRLNKLKIYVQKTGVATQGTVSENLVRFNESATPLMGKVAAADQPKMVAKFKAESAEMLQDLSNSGNLTASEVNKYKSKVQEISLELNQTDPARRADAINEIGITISNASIESEKRKETSPNQTDQDRPPASYAQDRPPASKPEPKLILTKSQTSDFLQSNLTTLYERAKTEGALTDDNVSNHLTQYTSAAREILIEIPAERQAAALNEFKASTSAILDDIVEKGYLPKEQIEIFVNDIQTDVQNLNSTPAEQRADLISQIGITLTEASQASSNAQGTSFDSKITDAFARIPSAGRGPKAMTHDKVTQYLKDYMTRLYERVKIEGALTQDKIAGNTLVF